MKRIGIFTATRWEFSPIRRVIQLEEKTRVGQTRCLVGRRGDCRLYLFQTGIGTARARAVCREALAAQPLDLVVSAGFACALTSSQIGDLLIGTEVIVSEHSMAGSRGLDRMFPCAAGWNEQAARASAEAGIVTHSGRFVTVPRVVWRVEDKRRLAADTDATGLDMESAGLAAEAARRGVPFAVLRTASDLLDEDLPLDFNVFLRPSGWLKGALTCLSRPSRVVGLNRLRIQSARASERLGRFFERFLDDLQV